MNGVRKRAGKTHTTKTLKLYRVGVGSDGSLVDTQKVSLSDAWLYAPGKISIHPDLAGDMELTVEMWVEDGSTPIGEIHRQLLEALAGAYGARCASLEKDGDDAARVADRLKAKLSAE